MVFEPNNRRSVVSSTARVASRKLWRALCIDLRQRNDNGKSRATGWRKANGTLAVGRATEGC
jgi:hypothetical protein